MYPRGKDKNMNDEYYEDIVMGLDEAFGDNPIDYNDVDYFLQEYNLTFNDLPSWAANDIANMVESGGARCL